MHQGLHGPRKQIVHLIEHGKTMGRFSAGVDPDMAARTMIALLYGFILPKLWDPKLSARAILAMFQTLLPSLLGTLREIPESEEDHLDFLERQFDLVRQIGIERLNAAPAGEQEG